MSNEKEVPMDRPQKPNPVKINTEAPISKGDKDDVISMLLNKSADEILPWEDCILPSQGCYYNGKVPDGKVQVKPMGITADKIFATTRLAQTGQSIEYIYKNHVRFPDESFTPEQLLTGDRVYLLFYLRAITHGNMYEFMVKCNNDSCGISSTYEHDLNEIEANKRGPKHAEEPVRVVLPYLSKVAGKEVWADCRFLRGHDLQTIATRQQFDKRAVGNRARGVNSRSANVDVMLDRSIEENLHMAIVSINGNTDRHIISELIKKMSQQDTQKIRAFLNDDAPGIDTEIVITCPACENEMRIELPITETFFRPKDSGGV